MSDRFSNSYHIEWSKSVKENNGFRCQICRDKGGILHSHHMNSYAFWYNERFDVKNGVTLCENCHNTFHAIYGKNLSTKSQFQEFKILTQLLTKLERQKLDLPYE